MLHSKCYPAIAAVLLLALVAAQLAAQTIARKQVSALVLKAFEQAYPNAKVRNFSRESREGKPCFELETIDGKTRRNLIYTDQGQVLEIEERIGLDQLPPAVRQSAAQAYPKGKILAAEKVTRGATVLYEVAVKDGKKRAVLSLGAAGQPVNAGKR